MKKMTVAYVLAEETKEILLGYKKVRLGKGFWDGFGGKVGNETIEHCASREIKSECGLSPKEIEFVGKIQVKYRSGEEEIELYFFLVKKFKGKIKESNEMIPRWFSILQIPYSLMWPTDKFILYPILRGRKFNGEVLYDNSEKKNLLFIVTHLY